MLRKDIPEFLPAILAKLHGHVEQGDRVRIDGKVVAGGVGLTAGLYGDILCEVEQKAAAKWKNVEKRLSTQEWTTIEVSWYRPNGRCVGKWIPSVRWIVKD